ncbi:DUF2335 domain-containing protein [Corynebacterium sp. 335C]
MTHDDDARDDARGRPVHDGYVPAPARDHGGSPPAQPHANGPVLPDGRHVDPGAAQPPLPGLDVLRSYELQYHGPLPPPGILEEYERFVPGSARRILDDAHADAALNRGITRNSFDAAVRLEQAGFAVAATVVFVCLALMGLCLLFLDFPESAIGVAAFGFTGATPVVLGFLGNRRGHRNGGDQRTNSGGE